MAAPTQASEAPPCAVDALTIGWLECGLAAGGLIAAVATFAVLPALQAAFAAAFLTLTLVITRSDVRTYTIPDWASASLALLGLLQCAWSASAEGSPVLPALLFAILSGAVAFALFWGIATAHRLLRGHEGLGFGDVKLAGACALWLAPAEQAATLEVAALVGLALFFVTTRRDPAGADGEPRAVPFGALLAPAAWLVHALGLLVPGWLP